MSQISEEKIKEYADILAVSGLVEFHFNDMYFFVFKGNARAKYVINVYISDEKDEKEIFYYRNIIDGTVCREEAIDAIRLCLTKKLGEYL